MSQPSASGSAPRDGSLLSGREAARDEADEASKVGGRAAAQREEVQQSDIAILIKLPIEIRQIYGIFIHFIWDEFR